MSTSTSGSNSIDSDSLAIFIVLCVFSGVTLIVAICCVCCLLSIIILVERVRWHLKKQQRIQQEKNLEEVDGISSGESLEPMEKKGVSLTVQPSIQNVQMNNFTMDNVSPSNHTVVSKLSIRSVCNSPNAVEVQYIQEAPEEKQAEESSSSDSASPLPGQVHSQEKVDSSSSEQEALQGISLQKKDEEEIQDFVAEKTANEEDIALLSPTNEAKNNPSSSDKNDEDSSSARNGTTSDGSHSDDATS